MPQGKRAEAGQQPISNWLKEDLSKEAAAIARLDRGDSYRRKGDHKAAIAEYTGVLESGDLYMSLTHEARALHGRADSRSMTGDHAGAITDYTEAIDSGLLSNSNGALAHCGRATARHLSGDSPGAVSDFTIALESGHLSDRAKAQARLARAGLLRQAGDHKGAITDFTEALDSGLLPGVAAASAQARRGDSRRLTDDFKGAIDDLTVALASKQLPPKIAPDAQRSLGNARLLLDGDARGALSDFIAAQDRLRVSRETAAEPQFGQADATPSSSNNPLANQSSRQLSSKRKADVQSGPPESRQRVGSHPDAIPHVVPGLNSGSSPALPRTAGQQGRDHARQPQTSAPDGVQAGAPGRAPQHRAPPSRGRGARGS